jgi:hypothetical protein
MLVAPLEAYVVAYVILLDAAASAMNEPVTIPVPFVAFDGDTVVSVTATESVSSVHPIVSVTDELVVAARVTFT